MTDQPAVQPKPLGRVTAQGARVTALGQVAKFLVQLASIVILSRLLTPTDYGKVAMVMAIAGIANVLGDLGLSLASAQRRDVTRSQQNNLFWINVLIGVGLAGSIVLLASPISAFYDEPDLQPVAMTLSIVFLLNASVGQFRADAMRQLAFTKLTLAEVLSQVFGLAAGVVAGVLGAGYWALVAQQVAIPCASLAFLIIWTTWRPGLPRKNADMRTLLQFGAGTSAVQVINYASSNIDNVLIGRELGATLLGTYSRAYQVLMLPVQQLIAPLTRVALPVLSRVSGTPRFLQFARTAQIALGYGVLLTTAMLAGAAEPLINLALGEQWAGAAEILQVLAVGGAFQIMGYIYYWTLLATGRIRTLLLWESIGRGIMVILIVAAATRGTLAVAAAVSAGLALVWLLATVFAVPATGLRRRDVLLPGVAPTLIAASVASAMLCTQAALSPTTPDLLALACDFGSAALVFSLAMLFPKVRQDITLLRSLR